MLCQKWMEQVLQVKDQDQAAEWAGAKKPPLKMNQPDRKKVKVNAVTPAEARGKANARKPVNKIRLVNKFIYT